MLLTIEHGDRRLSREDGSVTTKLNESVALFQDLCKISRENKDELGIKAGDCKELGDSASRLMRELQQEVTGLNTFAQGVLQQKDFAYGTWQQYKDRQESLESQESSKQESLDVSCDYALIQPACLTVRRISATNYSVFSIVISSKVFKKLFETRKPALRKTLKTNARCGPR